MPFFEAVAKVRVHLDACMRADGVAGFGAACSEALDGPAYFLAVHGGEVAVLCGGDRASSGGFVMSGGVFEESSVAALGLDDLEPRLVGVAAAQDIVGELCSCFGSASLAGEMEHPAREDVGEFDKVPGHRVAVMLHDVDALPDFDPVAGEAAEWLVHAGEEGDGAGVGGFAGFDHELGEEFCFFGG